MNNNSERNSGRVKVWDLPLRIFHWGLVTGFIVSFVSVKTDNMEIHIISATFVLGLLIFRVLWGILGSFTSRFATFIPGFGRLFRYLTGQDDGVLYPGHTPLGALSVVALLLCLIFQLLTGLIADDEIYITGPLRDYVGSELSSWATARHGLMSDVLLGLVALHLVAILFYWLVKKNNLVKPMFTGYKTMYGARQGTDYAEYSILVALIVIAVSAVSTYAVFNWL